MIRNFPTKAHATAILHPFFFFLFYIYFRKLLAHAFVYLTPMLWFPKKRICGFLSPDSRDTDTGLFSLRIKRKSGAILLDNQQKDYLINFRY